MSEEGNGSENECAIEIMMIGDSYVGKSKILERLKDDNFTIDNTPTISSDLCMRRLQIDGTKVKLMIWDTAGAEKYRKLNHIIFYQRVNGAAVVYDVTNRSSFDNITTWISELRSNAPDNVIIMIIGNKSDSDPKRAREVTEEEGRQLALEEDVLFMEVSAREAVNVEEAFRTLLAYIYCGILSKENDV
ncbi:hypothetical protein LUZ60_012919 [Juncus effusus]|nr:hypothetical protein LUZ60_012919 [Juncus effusus]